MLYRIWDSVVIRDATPEEIEQFQKIPKPEEEQIMHENDDSSLWVDDGDYDAT